MKKIIILTMALGIILMPGSVKTWDDCPYGLCDHSQLAPEDREVVEPVEEDVVVEPVVVVSESPEKKPIKKLLPVIKLVLAHLAGILAYVGYKKYRSGRE